jgi:hypothetical protein
MQHPKKSARGFLFSKGKKEKKKEVRSVYAITTPPQKGEEIS